MRLHDALTPELDALRARLGRNELSIIETGSIRAKGEQYELNDGWSTVAFAHYVAQHGGSVLSIDLDTRVADEVLGEHGLRQHVRLETAHSIDAMSRLLASDVDQFDVAYLDSDNDAQLILHEYLIARHLVRLGGLIMVDDIDMSSGGDARKGHKIVPWLREEGIGAKLHRRTGRGYSTGILIIGAPSQDGDFIHA